MNDAEVILAVQNYGTSGTLFLQSLLDSHPHVLATPALHSQQFHFFWKGHATPSEEKLIDAFCEWHAHWFEPAKVHRQLGLHQMGAAMDEILVIDRDEFTRRLRDRLARVRLDRRAFLLATHRAYADVRGVEPRRPTVLVFPIHGAPRWVASQLFEDFADALRILHVVREPTQNLGSVFKHVRAGEGWRHLDAAECAIAQVLLDFTVHAGAYPVYGSRPYLPELAAASRALRLEDLHRAPRPALEALCAWLGIPWSDSLLQSTFDGKLWWNRPESKRVSGFSSAIVGNRHDDLFSPLDRARLDSLTRRQRRAWGYRDRVVALHPALLVPSLLLPFRIERSGVAFAERAFARQKPRLERALAILLQRVSRLRWPALARETARREQPARERLERLHARAIGAAPPPAPTPLAPGAAERSRSVRAARVVAGLLDTAVAAWTWLDYSAWRARERLRGYARNRRWLLRAWRARRAGSVDAVALLPGSGDGEH